MTLSHQPHLSNIVLVLLQLGTMKLAFNVDFTDDGINRMNVDQIQLNASRLSGRHFINHQDNDPKHMAKETTGLFRVMMRNILDWPDQTPDLSPPEQLVKTRLKAERPD